MNREWIIMWDLKLILIIGNSFGGHFSTPNSINKCKLFISENNIPHIKLISDGPPPILIF